MRVPVYWQLSESEEPLLASPLLLHISLCFQHTQLRAGAPFWTDHCTHNSAISHDHQVSVLNFILFILFFLPKALTGVVLSCHNNSSDPHLDRDSWPENCLQRVFVSWLSVASLEYFRFVSSRRVISKHRNRFLSSFFRHKILFGTELCILPCEI